MPMRELLQSGARQLAPEQALPKLLRAIRSHLDMEVAFISQFADGRRMFRYVDSAPDAGLVCAGDGDPLEESYCARVVDGRLPELINDARALPEAAALPVTHALPVGAHLSVPIRLSDGSVYGTLCCFSRRAEPSMNPRDLAMLRVLADLTADRLDQDLVAERKTAEIEARIGAVLGGDGLWSAYQPICDLARGTVVGYECLARFSAPPRRGPDVWFAEAASVGLGAELELKAIEVALPAFGMLDPACYLSVNLSARMPAEKLLSVLAQWPTTRLVLEITEHEVVEEYEALAETLRPLRERGARIAVDDAGAGFASFRHILRLRPDFIKLDMSLTRGVDTDPARRALATALVRFAADTGSAIIAEGVETATELAALRALGVAKAQGYFLGKPAPLEELERRTEAYAG